MSASSWLDDIVFNDKTENDGLLRIDFMSSGMECYYKKISTKEPLQNPDNDTGLKDVERR